MNKAFIENVFFRVETYITFTEKTEKCLELVRGDRSGVWRCVLPGTFSFALMLFILIGNLLFLHLIYHRHFLSVKYFSKT